LTTSTNVANASVNPDGLKIARRPNECRLSQVGSALSNPAVKALREGKLSMFDAPAYGKQSIPGDITALKRILGDGGFSDCWPNGFVAENARRYSRRHGCS